MQRRIQTSTPLGVRWKYMLPVALVVVAALGNAWPGLAAAGPPDTAAKFYAVPLSDDPAAFGIDINNKGQVAFTEFVEEPRPVGTTRARFFDGATLHSIGFVGGGQAQTRAVNRHGQVTGFATTPMGHGHAFRWSKETGLIALSPNITSSFGEDINNGGEVAGAIIVNVDQLHAAFWNSRNVLQDLGTLAGTAAMALALNDAGTVVGWSSAPRGPDFRLPFRWTLASGMQSLATYPSENAQASDINADGYIVGSAAFREDGPDRAFLWTPRAGLMDIGGSGPLSRATRINDKGMVIGFLGNGFGFAWTREHGLTEIGSPDFSSSLADDLNKRGQVVGSVGNRAYVWTRARGIVDLNTRVRNAPQGLVLVRALAISDKGSIVATTNTGLVLLTERAISDVRPLAGPLSITGKPRAGNLLSFSASFTDADQHDTHKATWDWGDGSSEAGTVNERNGSGNVSGQHAYRAAGEYTVRLTLTDSGGKSSTVQQVLIVQCGCGR
ncbi:PKD domain-containing protein [Massilia sp. GCM10020059]|uniref:PKD domain-containing protein n=1 Tax=Massilia agrisoli TaxID=2892444 RepID=A0ABS8IQB4_9BURK|nr:PKD domain-containing protein [Massilia agrisoli]MCC6070799.1 hypothetical protein [Massilia agrisoli]